MANARNYEEYRRQVLDDLGVEYVTEDITDFRRWRLKVLKGLADLITKGDMTEPVAKWLDAHPEIVTALNDGEVTTAKIADDAITGDKIADGVVTRDKLGEDVGEALDEPYQKYISNTYPDQNEHELYMDMVRKNLVSYLVRNNFSSCFKTGEAYNDDDDGYKTVFKYGQGRYNYMGLYGSGNFVYNEIVTVDGVDYHVAYLDCVTFVSIITRGRAFEDSPYAYAFSHPDATLDDMFELGLEDPDPKKNYTFDFLNNLNTSNAVRIMNNSGNTLQLLASYPEKVVYEDVYNRLETGDVIWFGANAYETRYKSIGHVGLFVKTLEELDEVAEEYNITFQSADGVESQYGYIVEVWSDNPIPYKDTIIIHSLEYWVNSPRSISGRYLNLYMTKGYANTLNSNKQFALMTGMYRLFSETRFVNPLSVTDGIIPSKAIGARIDTYSTFNFAGSQPSQLKDMNIDEMSLAKYNGVWMPYNTTDRDSVQGTFPISMTGKFYTLIITGGIASGRGAKQILIISDKNMASDEIIYIRQTGASSSEYGAWKKISITSVT